MTTLSNQAAPPDNQGTLADHLKTLTRRESEVLEFIIKGLSNDQIAQELFRSPKTIDKHCQSIYKKTGLHKRVNLVREVIQLRAASAASAVSASGQSTATATAVESIVRKSRAWDKMARYESILSRSTGPGYFGDLVKALAETFGVKMAGICEVNTDEGYGDIIAYCVDGKLQAPYRYELSNSACGIAHTEGYLEQFDDLVDRFGHADCLLVNLGFRSYIGIRLDDRLMGPIGTLWIADKEPIDEADMPLAILRIFAPRVASELATQKTLDQDS